MEIVHSQKATDPSGSVVFSKTCTGCNFNKELSCFNRNKIMKDGLQAYCKVCRARRYVNDRERLIKKAGENKRKNPKQKETDRIWMRKFRNKDKDRIRAQTHNRVKNGLLTPILDMLCDKCAKPAKEYHHPDYDKPEWVIPLCKACHGKEHRKYD